MSMNLRRLPLFNRRANGFNDPAQGEIFEAGQERPTDAGAPVEQTTTARPAAASNAHRVKPLPRAALRWIGPTGRIAIREMDFAADASAVCDFQAETYALNFAGFRYTEDFAAAFRHDLRRASLDNNHALYVLDEGEIVGFLWLLLCENSWTNERYGYINNIYLVQDRRNQGLGDELMKQADAFFRGRHVQRVRLTVTASNASAIALYKRCGYDTTRWEMEKQI